MSNDSWTTPEVLPLQNRRETIFGVLASFLAASWLCVGARIYTRLFIVKSPGWDDVFVLLSLVFGSCSVIVICQATNYGLGHHFQGDPDSVATFLKIYWISWALFSTANPLIKLSFLFQYLRVFEGWRTRVFCKILIWLVAGYGISFGFLSWFPCFPVYHFWTDHQQCYGFGSHDPWVQFELFLSLYVLNMAFDGVILAIPVHLFWDPDTPRKTKNGLVFLLLVGAMLTKAATLKPLGGMTFDPTWSLPMMLLLSEMENKTSIICASIPVFWPIFSASVTRIFITHEVNIESHPRYDTSLELRCCGDGRENTRDVSLASDTTLKFCPTQVTSTTHYNDEYVQAQIRPWDMAGQVESTIYSVQGGPTRRE